MQYHPQKIEKKWQRVWEKQKLYRALDKSKKKKYYALVEFPYPSGDGLHVGHVRSYTAMDVVARKRRMEGFNVLYPIGWDAFGLPTENYAIKAKIHPKIVTKQNTDTFRRQLQLLGFSFDWAREINTTDPAYYKWTQWIFLKLFEAGLAYKAKTTINWCPKDKIGLANEEVVGGACERCGTQAEKREKEQWMLKITAYAEKLLEGLQHVDYILQAKTQQENWIGKSEGALIKFPFNISEVPLPKIEVFTTRADTLFGATYLVLAPEHQSVERLNQHISNYAEVKKYITEARKKTDIERTSEGKEKTGVELKGIKAVNPANKEEIPVWISDYVLAGYGTGAIMAVPAHDERDFEFAKKFKLPIVTVIEPETGEPRTNEEKRQSIVAIVEDPKTGKLLSINWGDKLGGSLFVGGGLENGEDAVAAARREVTEETGYQHLELVEQSEKIHHHYVATSKGVNRFIEAVGLYFRLKDEARTEPKLEANEKNKFTVGWISKDEAEKKVIDPSHRYVFERLIKGKCYMGEGFLMNSGKFEGMRTDEARRRITEYIGGKITTQYKLRDWVFSRQRYWGEPIPLVYCENCAKRAHSLKPKTYNLKPSTGELLNPGWVPVPEKNLPVELPNVKNYMPTDTGESPLANIKSWVKAKCPRCGGQARRETDVMPNWAGSSWYFLAYLMSRKAFKNKTSIGNWKLEIGNFRHFMPVDWYNGGMEHTVLHLLYSRFWNQFLFDQKLVPTREPYKKRTSHGLILGEGGIKMSKSKGNVVNPDTVVKEFGADALRLYEMFLGPFNQPVAWDPRGIVGMSRFLERVWLMNREKKFVPKAHDTALETLLHKTLKKVSEDIESMSFNTAVSALMIFANECAKREIIARGAWGTFLVMLAPFAPHIAEELWRGLGEKKSIHLAPWPAYDKRKIIEETFTLIVQINGKVRDSFEAPRGILKEEAEKLTLSRERVRNSLGNKPVRKIVFVPGRLVNIVL